MALNTAFLFIKNWIRCPVQGSQHICIQPRDQLLGNLLKPVARYQALGNNDVGQFISCCALTLLFKFFGFL